MAVKGTQSRFWLYTINNPTEQDGPENWEELERPRTVYSIWQKECGAEGTEHYQGYVVFDKPQYLSACKKLNARAHWEPRKGSHAQAVTYCTKEDTRVSPPRSYGSDAGLAPSGSGPRTDLDIIKGDMDNGISEADLWRDQFGQCVRYHKSFTVYRTLRTPPRTRAPDVFVFWGPTAIGKSTVVFDESPSAFWKSKPAGSSHWWDGYDGTQDIVLDEYYGWISWSFLLRLLDRFPIELEVRGGRVPCAAKRVFITSNSHPVDWYRYGPRMAYQTLRRRITAIFTRSDLVSDWKLESDARAVTPSIICHDPESSRSRHFHPYDL